MDELTNEKSIGAFLMSARKRVQPEMVGLKRTPRRRTAGLRREEVAEIANIGVSWYTAIEQGKEVHPSAQVLESIAEALLLTPPERNYLFQLAQSTEQVGEIVSTILPAGIKEIVTALDPNPVYVIDERWDFVDWNAAAALVFDYADFTNGKQPPNLLNHFLLSSHMQQLIDEWEPRAKVMIARYRADFLKFPQDPGFLANIHFLETTSPLFKAEWPKNEIRVLSNSSKKWQHPKMGEVGFEQIILTSPEAANYKIVTFMADAATKLKIQTASH